jgi:hypothetical protein
MTETPTLAQRCITVAEAVGDDPERAGDTLREVAAALEAQAAQIAERDAQIEALRARAELWCGLYKRAINEANGLTNYVEDRPELRSAERKLEAIQTEARAAMAAKEPR